LTRTVFLTLMAPASEEVTLKETLTLPGSFGLTLILTVLDFAAAIFLETYGIVGVVTNMTNVIGIGQARPIPATQQAGDLL
jgi:hypothetical protein